MDQKRSDGVLNGTWYIYDFVWSRSPGSKASCGAGWFVTKEECDLSLRHALIDMGYTSPKWWQYWRWGEARPSIEL